MLNSGNDLFSFNRAPSFIRDKEGTFEFQYVLPGSYFIQTQPGGVRTADGSAPLPMLGRLSVTVGNEDVDNLVEGALKQQRLLVIAPREAGAEDLGAILRASL